MSKAAAAFRTISEVAQELDVPKHVLRFWELKFPQLKPMKRGGGRRYYRPEDLELLRGIRHLLHSDGYTIKGVQKILREQGVEAAKAAARQGKNTKQTLPEAGLSKSAARASKRTKSEPRGAARLSGARTSNKLKTKGATTKSPHAVMPAKAAKAVERAIAELKACRDILQPIKVPYKASSTTAKPRRSRAAR